MHTSQVTKVILKIKHKARGITFSYFKLGTGIKTDTQMDGTEKRTQK